jgi:hypothetical protein
MAEVRPQMEALLADFDITHFHAKDFAHKQGQFAGWSPDRLLAFLDRHDVLCERNTLFAFSVVVNNADYDEHFKGADPPRKVQLDSRYGICFRLCLIALPTILWKLASNKKIAINLVLESGHRNAGDAERIFALCKQQAPKDVSDIFASLSFADKRTCYGVQAADSIAFPAYRIEQRETLPVVEFSLENDDWCDIREYSEAKHPCFRVAGTPKILADIRSNIIAETEQRRTWGARKSLS